MQQPRLRFEARVRRALSRAVRPAQAKVRRGVLRMADSVVMLRAVTPDPSHVLIVRLDNIGDFVVWLDAARALVEHYRAEGKRVVLAGNAAWAGLAGDLGLFDEVIAVRQQAFRSSLRYRLGLLKQIRGGAYGIVLQPTLNRVAEMGDAIVRASGAKERIGVGLESGSRGPDVLAPYTKLLTSDPAQGEMPANAAVVRQVTGRDYKAKVADLSAVVDEDGLGDIAPLVPASAYVVLFPGASAAGRQWPEGNFAEFARRCHDEYGCPVLVCGGPGDLQVAANVVSAAGGFAIDLAGKTSLSQLATVIAGATLLVSNETSAVHMAAAVGVASICITGGGHFGRFVPYQVDELDRRPLPLVATKPMPCFGCNWVCQYHPARGKPMPCVEEVFVDVVWNLATPVLKRQFIEAEVLV